MEFLNPNRVLYREVSKATMDFLHARMPSIWSAAFQEMHQARYKKPKPRQAGDNQRYVRWILKKLNACFPIERTRQIGMAANWVNEQQIFRLLIHTEYLRVFASGNKGAQFVCRVVDTMSATESVIRVGTKEIAVPQVRRFIAESAREISRIYALEILSVEHFSQAYNWFTIRTRQVDGEERLVTINEAGGSEHAFYSLLKEANKTDGSKASPAYLDILRRCLIRRLASLGGI